MIKRLMAAAVACGVLAAGAQAQLLGGGRRRGGGGACKTDIQALCAGQKGGQVKSCLATNVDKIQNADCKANVQKYQAKDNAVKQACSADISSSKCDGMDIGTGLLKCLAKNRKNLSDGCKAELKKGRGSKGGSKGGKDQGGESSGDSDDSSDQ